MRMARWAEDDDFNGWVAALKGGEPEGQHPDTANTPAVMPDIPVAGVEEEPVEVD